MKKIAQCAALLAFALAFVGCNLQDEPKASSLQDALNDGGTVNLDDYALSSSETYTINTDTVITGNARGAHFAIADGTDVTFDSTKDIGTVTVGSSTSRNAVVRAATRTGGVKISLKGSGVTIGKVFIKVDCTFTSDNASNSFGSVVVAETVTSLTLERQTNVSALVSTGEANVKITVSAEATIEKADTIVIDSVKENNPNITIDIPKISDDELKKLQNAFAEESKKDPVGGNTSNNDTTNPEVIPRGSRIAAEYVQKAEIALYADGIAIFTRGLPVSGTYTEEANGDLTLHIPYGDYSGEMVELAKINGNTMTLYDYDEVGSLNQNATFTKKATNSDPSALTEWEWYDSLSLTFALDGSVQFFEDSALCWTGTYTVTEDDIAVTEDVRQVGNPWGEDDRHSPPLKVEFDFSYKTALYPNVYTSEGGGWSPFLTRVGDMTVKTPTSSGNTNETNPGNNEDNTSGTKPGNNTGNTNPDGNTSGTNPGNNGNNTGTTNPGDGDGNDNTKPGENDDDDKNNVAIIPRESRIAAKYVQKWELAFYADDTAVMTMGWPVYGTYTKEANGDLAVRMPLLSDDRDEVVYLAKFNSGTMMLYYYDEYGNLSEHALTFTKKATNTDPSALTEWEYISPLSLTFALDGTVQFFEDSALCWTGTYTVTEDNFAVTKDIQQVGSPWDNMTHPVKVEFTFDRNALMWDVLYGNGGSSSFLTQVGDITVETTTSGGNTESTPGGDGDDDKSDDDEHDAGAFKNGAIDATYVQKLTLTFADGIVTYDANGISTDNSTTYTQDGDSRTFDFAKLLGSDDDDMQMQATATINGNELTLNTVSSYKDDDGEIQTVSGERIFKKSSTGTDSWEYAIKLTLSSQKTVSFYENDKLCWTGNYEVTDERNATVSNVTIADQAIFDSIFGNDTKIVALWDSDNPFIWIRCKLEGQNAYNDIAILK